MGSIFQVNESNGNTTITGSLTMSSQQIHSVANPTSAQDAATKNYVDGLVNGLSWKQPVIAATTVAGTLATSFANGSVIDGITLVTGDRILIKNQAAPAENGIYTVNVSGSPTRALDMDAWTEVPAAATIVTTGTVNADKAYVCTSDFGGTIGVTAITFVLFASIDGGVLSITGTANQIIASASTGAITLSTPQDIATSSTPTFASETLTSTTNQLVLGTTRTVTVSATQPATTSRTYTIPDQGAAANFVLDQSNYTIAGTWKFSNVVTLGTASSPPADSSLWSNKTIYVGTTTNDTTVGSYHRTDTAAGVALLTLGTRDSSTNRDLMILDGLSNFSSGNRYGMQVNITDATSSTANYNGIDFNLINSSSGSGTHNLYVFKVGGVAKSTLTYTGALSLSDSLTLASSKAVVLTDNTTNTVTMKATNSTTSWTLQLPTTAGTSTYFLQTDGSGTTTWAPGGAGGITQLTGDVTAGPGAGSQAATVALVGGQTAAAVASSVGIANSALNNAFNLLYNGGMEIYQNRNTTATNYVTGDYFIDGWKFQKNSNRQMDGGPETGAGNVQAGLASILANSLAGNTSTDYVYQPIENAVSLRGKTISFSAYVKTSTANAARISIDDNIAAVSLSSFQTGSGTFELLTVTHTVSNTCTDLRIGLAISAQATIYFDSAMAVMGSTSTSFVPSDPEIDLARCQRYYEKSYALTDAPGTNTTSNVGYNVATGGTGSFSAQYCFKVTKRTNPTLTVYTATGTSGSMSWSLSGQASTNRVTTGVTSNGVIPINGFQVTQTVNNTDNYVSGHWVADARM